jgi:serine/threonine protein kinase
VIVDALESTDPITSVQEVPLVYLESISNHRQSEIGFGGFGTVYEGIDMEANFKMAIKVLRTDALSEKHKTDFETEIEVSSGTVYFHIWRRFALTYMLFGAMEFVQVEPAEYCPYIGKDSQQPEALYCIGVCSWRVTTFDHFIDYGT